MKTIGSRITPHLKPMGGFSAEMAAATSIGLATFAAVPISTTHAIAGGIAGVGTSHNWRAVRTVGTLFFSPEAWVRSLLARGLPRASASSLAVFVANVRKEAILEWRLMFRSAIAVSQNPTADKRKNHGNRKTR